MAPPPIRTVAIYNTHEVHSIDFFGNEVTVTVTADASVICEWISNVHTYDCAPLTYSHHPLVVGVGVQWTPFCYGDSSPGSYNSDEDSYSPPPPPRRYTTSIVQQTLSS
ncbi:hypothetical protein Bca4012_004049 [Brassica carinata]